MTRGEIVRQLLADLLDDHQQFHEIEAHLSAQRQAVLRFSQPDLEHHTDVLMQHYRQIHQHAQQRIVSLQQLGLSADQQGMTQLLQGLAPAAQQHLLKIWYELPQQLQRCQQANTYNQQLLDMQHSLLVECMPQGDTADWLYHPHE
ncbi:flagellar export chaperone FlgN [Rosenbergiella australiborealis]|uniref:flagellar export chaperone FlgN n=1 Tax=Rosenbergiella australiborealis TaxID=1544696 RepID=UPI001F4D4061|nr:flagellar export chaperone FlgN [Rosenbergiella australiborealis]